MAEEKTGGNRKRAKVNTDNKFKDFFLNFWIWFKETAWIQVVLVVVLVFGIVLSIPLIVRAVTATPDPTTVALDYYNGRRKKVSEVNSLASDTSKKYTTVLFYSEDASSQATTVASAFKDNILGGNNAFQKVNETFYTIDLTRDENNADTNVRNSPDITTAQKTSISTKYAEFYQTVIQNYAGNFLDLDNEKTVSPKASGKTIAAGTFPTDYPVIAVYKNGAGFNLETATPSSLLLGFSATDVATVRKEFFAAISVNFDNRVATFLSYDPNDTSGGSTDEFLRYRS